MKAKTQSFQEAMQQYHAAMETYLDQMESANGQLALVMLSGVGALVHSGAESPAALACTIKKASILSGIPEDALEAHVRFTVVMLEYFNQQ